MAAERRRGEGGFVAGTLGAPVVGTLAPGSAPARLLVRVPGGPDPRRARTTVKLDARAIREAVAARQGVLLLFEEGDPARPIVVGLLEAESETPLLDAVLEARPRLEVKVDRKRRVIEAADELELRCGRATITLRRNGKVVIRGAYVESYADGINRIKGGAVKIN